MLLIDTRINNIVLVIIMFLQRQNTKTKNSHPVRIIQINSYYNMINIKIKFGQIQEIVIRVCCNFVLQIIDLNLSIWPFTE